MCTTCMPQDCRGQERTPCLLELGLHMAEGHHVGSENWIQVFARAPSTPKHRTNSPASGLSALTKLN